MMPEVAFATYQKSPEMNDDDRLVALVLRARGVSVRSVVWDAPGVDWSHFDCVVIRSAWDYHLKAERYARWVRGFAQAGNRLWNPPQAVLENINKRYLADWGTRGIEVVPTVYQRAAGGLVLRELLERCPWEEVVIKPAVSASAHGTWRTSRASAEADQARFAELAQGQDVLIQPYMPEIADQGEWSLVFFGGRYSHAVLKRPAAGDFRVQQDLGGDAVHAEPDPGLIEQARKVLSTVDQPLLYARVDGIEREGKLVLMELEINEPLLWVATCDGAARNFAEAIMQVLG